MIYLRSKQSEEMRNRDEEEDRMHTWEVNQKNKKK